MVYSKLISDINYIESKSINKDDEYKELDLYEIELYDIKVVIALGNIKNTYIDKNIIYYPIYLIKNNKKSITIGLYELFLSDYPNSSDSEGNVNLENLNEPLLFNFVTKDFILNNRFLIEEDLEINKEEGDNYLDETKEKSKLQDIIIPITRKDIFSIIENYPNVKKLKQENEADAKEIIDNYIETNADVWIQKFMKNKNYTIQDNEGNGDCFFAVVRDAFLSIGQETSVYKIRKKIADNATEEIFTNYRNNYEMYNNSYINDTKMLTSIKNEFEELKNRQKNALDNNEINEIKIIGKKLKTQFDKINQERKITKELLDDLKFMKNIKNLANFRKKIETCEFWADVWAISTMERILNVKFIILSSEAYKDNDYTNVLKCGHTYDAEIERSGVFNPEYYIMVEHTGNHYKLIGYKGKKIFNFEELPYHIKKMIVEKCMETFGGIFNMIPEFIAFKNNLNGKKEINDYKNVSEAEIRNLFDNDIVFLIHSNASTKLLPGKSTGEKINNDKVKNFSELKNYPEWRRKLDDSWNSEFVLNGHKWYSVENYVQGSKFKKENPDFYLQFSLDSDSEISKNPDLAKNVVESKTGLIKGKRLKPKNIKPDSDFMTRLTKEHYEATFAKINQNPELKNILIETKNAKLMNYKKGKEPETADNLMIIRDIITKS